MLNLDTTTLTDVIQKCFAFSSDGRFSAEQQAAFLADGKRLRGLLLNLLSAQFDDGTQAVLDANAKLSDVNTQLDDDAEVLAKAATTLTNIANLVSSLDKLLNVAASFL